jgi:hypothetical protein
VKGRDARAGEHPGLAAALPPLLMEIDELLEELPCAAAILGSFGRHDAQPVQAAAKVRARLFA